jgi:hypothetical protein
MLLDGNGDLGQCMCILHYLSSVACFRNLDHDRYIAGSLFHIFTIVHLIQECVADNSIKPNETCRLRMSIRKHGYYN